MLEAAIGPVANLTGFRPIQTLFSWQQRRGLSGTCSRQEYKAVCLADKAYKIYLRLIWSYEDGRELLGAMPAAQQMGKRAHLRALVADGVKVGNASGSRRIRHAAACCTIIQDS